VGGLSGGRWKGLWLDHRGFEVAVGGRALFGHTENGCRTAHCLLLGQVVGVVATPQCVVSVVCTPIDVWYWHQYEAWLLRYAAIA
jgi:hypothetical protein